MRASCHLTIILNELSGDELTYCHLSLCLNREEYLKDSHHDVEDDDGEKGEAHEGVLPVVSVDLGEDVAHDEDDDDHDLRRRNQLVIDVRPDGW